jgi:hypothetical protein
MERPIACSLTPGDAATRAAETTEIARAALRRREPIDRGARLVFGAADETEARLQRIVAAERECCPFLTLDLRRAGDELLLDVTGPPDAQPIVAALFTVT